MTADKSLHDSEWITAAEAFALLAFGDRNRRLRLEIEAYSRDYGSELFNLTIRIKNGETTEEVVRARIDRLRRGAGEKATERRQSVDQLLRDLPIRERKLENDLRALGNVRGKVLAKILCGEVISYRGSKNAAAINGFAPLGSAFFAEGRTINAHTGEPDVPDTTDDPSERFRLIQLPRAADITIWFRTADLGSLMSTPEPQDKARISGSSSTTGRKHRRRGPPPEKRDRIAKQMTVDFPNLAWKKEKQYLLAIRYGVSRCTIRSAAYHLENSDKRRQLATINK